MKHLKKSLILLIILLANYNIKSSEIEIKQTVDNKSQNELNNRLWKAVEDLDLNEIKYLIETKGSDIKHLNNPGNIDWNSQLAKNSAIGGPWLIIFLIPQHNNDINIIKLKILEYLISKGLNFDQYKDFILNMPTIIKTPSFFKVLLDKGAKISEETILIDFIENNIEKLDKLIPDYKKGQDIDYITISDVIYALLIQGASPCETFFQRKDFFDYMKESNDLRKIWKKYLNFIDEIKKILIQNGIPSKSVDQIILDYGYITNKSQC